MPRLTIGIPATFNYRTVRYYPFCVSPGVSSVPTGDPWSYLCAHLSQRIDNSRGRNRDCLERALYYTELAESFYSAADATRFPAKCTVIYYGMLNLVKSFISVRGVELERTWEHHGLQLPQGYEFKVAVTSQTSSHISIFHEFARIMGTPVSQPVQLSLRDVFSHIPEIHQIAISLGLLPWSRSKFLPVDIRFLVNNSMDRVFTELRYERKNESHLSRRSFLRGDRLQYFRRIADDGDWIVYRSNRSKYCTRDNWERIYHNIRTEYSRFNIVSLLTPDGYIYYCDLRPGNYHHLCYTLIGMFYLGTVARYRPSEANDVMQHQIRPLITEFLAISPSQFLYHLVSLTTDSVCVVPRAKLV